MPFRSITLRGRRFVDEVSIARIDDDFDRLVFSDQVLGDGGLMDAEAARLRDAGK
jgi:predicted glycosyltransferase